MKKLLFAVLPILLITGCSNPPNTFTIPLVDYYWEEVGTISIKPLAKLENNNPYTCYRASILFKFKDEKHKIYSIKDCRIYDKDDFLLEILYAQEEPSFAKQDILTISEWTFKNPSFARSYVGIYDLEEMEKKIKEKNAPK